MVTDIGEIEKKKCDKKWNDVDAKFMEELHEKYSTLPVKCLEPEERKEVYAMISNELDQCSDDLMIRCGKGKMDVSKYSGEQALCIYALSLKKHFYATMDTPVTWNRKTVCVWACKDMVKEYFEKIYGHTDARELSFHGVTEESVNSGNRGSDVQNVVQNFLGCSEISVEPPSECSAGIEDAQIVEKIGNEICIKNENAVLHEKLEEVKNTIVAMKHHEKPKINLGSATLEAPNLKDPVQSLTLNKRIEKIREYRKDMRAFFIGSLTRYGGRLYKCIEEHGDELFNEFRADKDVKKLRRLFHEEYDALHDIEMEFLSRVMLKIKSGIPKMVESVAEKYGSANEYAMMVHILYEMRKYYDITTSRDMAEFRKCVEQPVLQKSDLINDMEAWYKITEYGRELGHTSTEFATGLKFVVLDLLDKIGDKTVDFQILNIYNKFDLGSFSPDIESVYEAYGEVYTVVAEWSVNNRGKKSGERFFTKGTPMPLCKYENTPSGCRAGKSCKFKHTGNNRNRGSLSVNNVEKEKEKIVWDNEVMFNKKDPPVCRFFVKKGRCDSKNCKFSHNEEVAKRVRAMKCREPKTCKYGDACMFSHDVNMVDSGIIHPSENVVKESIEKPSLASESPPEKKMRAIDKISKEDLKEIAKDIFFMVEKGEINMVNVAVAEKGNGKKIKMIEEEWILDSGANIAVVPSEIDSAIVVLHDRESAIRTSSGHLRARIAIVRTPFGLIKGVIIRGSPRIIPMNFVQTKAKVSWCDDEFFIEPKEKGDDKTWNFECKVVEGIPKIVESRYIEDRGYVDNCTHSVDDLCDVGIPSFVARDIVDFPELLSADQIEDLLSESWSSDGPTNVHGSFVNMKGEMEIGTKSGDSLYRQCGCGGRSIQLKVTSQTKNFEKNFGNVKLVEERIVVVFGGTTRSTHG